MKESLGTEGRTGSGSEARLRCDANSSVEELQECAEATRQNVDRTMQKVEERLAPGRLYDDVWHFLRQALADARSRSGGLDQAVRDNPAAFAAMGIGLALLGGSIAGFAFKKMRENDVSPSGTPPRWEEAEPRDIPRTQWEPGAVTPPSADRAPETDLEHEATTEDVQRDLLASAERRNAGDWTEEEEEFARFEDQEEFATRKPRHS